MKVDIDIEESLRTVTRWGRAAIAAGEDPKHAEMAANNTIAFYTGDTGEESSNKDEE